MLKKIICCLLLIGIKTNSQTNEIILNQSLRTRNQDLEITLRDGSKITGKGNFTLNYEISFKRTPNSKKEKLNYSTVKKIKSTNKDGKTTFYVYKLLKGHNIEPRTIRPIAIHKEGELSLFYEIGESGTHSTPGISGISVTYSTGPNVIFYLGFSKDIVAEKITNTKIYSKLFKKKAIHFFESKPSLKNKILEEKFIKKPTLQELVDIYNNTH